MIVSPFINGKNYIFISGRKELETACNMNNLPEGTGTVEAKNGEKIKIKVKGNKLSAIGLNHDDLESVQRIFDWFLAHLKLPKVGRFRGFVSLKHHEIKFDVEEYKKKGDKEYGFEET